MINVNEDVAQYLKARMERLLNDILTAEKYSYMHDSAAAGFETASIALDMGVITTIEWSRYLDQKRDAVSRRITELSSIGLQSSPVDTERAK